MDLAATKAKELGADAIVVMSRGTVYAGSTGGVAANVYAGSFYGSSHSHLVYRGKATVLVIKWRQKQFRAFAFSTTKRRILVPAHPKHDTSFLYVIFSLFQGAECDHL